MKNSLKLAKIFKLYGKKNLYLLAFVLFFGVLFYPKTAIGSTIDLSFKQVMSNESPVVYYLDHTKGLKKAYVNENSFLAYSNKWSDIKIVSQEKLNGWRDAYLFKAENDNKVYYIKNGKKAWIDSEDKFTASGFQWNDIMAVLKSDLNNYQEVRFEDIFNNNLSATSVASQNNISVSLSGFPESEFLSIKTKDNLVGKITLSGAINIKLSELNIYFQGVFRSEAIKSIYLTDESDTEKIKPAYFDGRRARFALDNYKSLNSYQIKIDLGDCYDCANNSFKIYIKSPEDIKANLPVVGNFPMESGYYKIIDASRLIAKVKISEKSLSYSNPELAIGSLSQKIGQFEISEISKNEDIIIKKLVFSSQGRLSEILLNFQLKNKRNKVIASLKQAEQNEIIFELNDYLIKAGESEVFTIEADIAGGEGQSVNLNINDYIIKGGEHNFGIEAEISNIDGEVFKIIREKLGVMAMETKAGKNVFSQKSGTLIAVYEIRNNNQAIIIQELKAILSKTESAPDLENEVTVVNYDTGDILAYANLRDGKYLFNFSNLELGKKKKVSLAFIAKISNSAPQGARYFLPISEITYQIEGGQYLIDYPAINAVPLVISNSNLYINGSENNQFAYSKGEKGVKIGSFWLESSFGENANISSISFSRGNTSGIVNYSNGFSNLRLYIGTKRVGQIIERPFSDSFNFGDFAYRLNSQKRIEVKVYADTVRDLNVRQTELILTQISANNIDNGLNISVNGLNSSGGTIIFGEVSAELEMLSGGKVSIGEKENLIGSFKIKNTGNEELKLKNAIISTDNQGFSYSLGYSDLRVFKRENSSRIGRISRPVGGSNEISLSNIKILPGEEMVFDIYVNSGLSVPAGSVNIFISSLKAYGTYSKLEANLAGAPTWMAPVLVN